MKKLNNYNAFGTVLITSKYVGVTMYAFSSDGFMHKVANKFKVVPELPIKDRQTMPYAGTLKSGEDPDFIFSFIKEPAEARELVDEAQVIDSIYTVAYDLMKQLDFELPPPELDS